MCVEFTSCTQRMPTSHLSGVNILPVDRPQKGCQVAAQAICTEVHSHGTHPLEDTHPLHTERESHRCHEGPQEKHHMASHVVRKTTRPLDTSANGAMCGCKDTTGATVEDSTLHTRGLYRTSQNVRSQHDRL